MKSVYEKNRGDFGVTAVLQRSLICQGMGWEWKIH